jgi:mRNA interferase MazF
MARKQILTSSSSTRTRAGSRPACVLTRQAAIPVLLSVLVAPATRTVRGIPTEVTLTRADGMPQGCALSFDNLATVRRPS